MATLSELVGKRIKEIRESKNIKQNQLAEMINIEPTNLSKIEKGAQLPKIDTINKLTEALECNIQELFELEHLQTREELLNKIDIILKNAQTTEIQFFYKVLKSYKEIK